MNTLFDKYMTGELNESETKKLIEILQNESNGIKLVEYVVETQAILTFNENFNSLSRKKKGSNPIKFLIVTAIAALLTFAFFIFPSKPELKVVSAPNALLIRKSNQTTLIKNQLLSSGDIIEAHEKIALSFSDDSQINISSGSRLVIKSIGPDKKFFLERGTVNIITSPQTEGKLICSTDDLNSSALGTIFTVSKFKEKTLVRVIESKVLVKNLNKEIILKEGEEALGSSKNIITTQNKGFSYHRWLNWSKTFRENENIAAYLTFHNDVTNTLSEKFMGYQSRANKAGGRWAQKSGLLGQISFPESSNFNPGKELTLLAWIKLNKRNDHAPIITKGDNSWRLQLDGDSLLLDLSDGPIESDNPVRGKTTIDTNTWYFVSAVFTETQMKLYLNAELEGVANSSSRNFLNDAKVIIGGNDHQISRRFLGVIDEAAIINKTLSEEELKEIFLNSKP